MATVLPGAYLQEACQTAQGDRLVLSALVCEQGRAPGVGGELASTPGAGLSVDVASGSAFVEGTEDGWQGMYLGSNDSTLNVVLSAADPTDDRIDLIVMQFRDSAYSGTDDDFVIVDVTGTPSPSPVAPSVPDNSLILATVLVEAGDAAVDPGNITMGDFYTVCADAARASARLGPATTAITEGSSGSYAEWDGANTLSPHFSLQAGSSGPNTVLKYTGPAAWVAAYVWLVADDVIQNYLVLRVIHYDSSAVDLNDTPQITSGDGSGLLGAEDTVVEQTPVLFLSNGDLIAVYIEYGDAFVGTTAEFSHQMRVVAL